MIRFLVQITFLIAFISIFSDCRKIKEWKKDPDVTPLRDGFKVSAAIAYAASVAITAFEGQPLPSNVRFVTGNASGYSSSGILYIDVDNGFPLPFNPQTGQITVAGLWNGTSGVISVAFTNIDLWAGEFSFYGLHTVPIGIDASTGNYIAMFAKQDIVLGSGSDTLMNLSMSNPQFSTEIARLNTPQPTDVFVAASQNVWFINIDQNSTPSDIYDDIFNINGGGQMALVSDDEGGIVYHAMIDTRFTPDQCNLNPIHGDAFIQNLRAGDRIDLGTLLLSFHSDCNGKAHVEVGTGKYLGANNKDIPLNFN